MTQVVYAQSNRTIIYYSSRSHACLQSCETHPQHFGSLFSCLRVNRTRGRFARFYRICLALFDPGLIRVNLCSLLSGKNSFGSLLRLLAPPIPINSWGRSPHKPKALKSLS